MRNYLLRLVPGILLLMCFASTVEARYQFYIVSGQVGSDQQQVGSTPVHQSCLATLYDATTIKVYLAGTNTLATIYASDGATTPIPGSTYTLPTGVVEWYFYADTVGPFEAEFTKTGITAFRSRIIANNNMTGFYNVKTDFGATGDGVTDDTEAIRNAINYVAVRNGGTLYFPQGDYIVGTVNPSSFTGFDLPSGITIEGTNGDANSNCRIRLRNSNQSIFKIGECKSGITISKIMLEAQGGAALHDTNGISLAGNYPFSSMRMLFSNMSIRGFEKGISVDGHDTTPPFIGEWQCDHVKVDHLTIFDSTKYAMWINTNNADYWQISNTNVTVLKDGYGIYLARSGFWLIENSVGTAQGANGQSPDAGETFVYLNSVSTIVLLQNLTEGYRKCLEIGGGNYGEPHIPITLINNTCGDKIEIGADVLFNSYGNSYSSNGVQVVGGTFPRIFSVGDFFGGSNFAYQKCGIDIPASDATCKRDFYLNGTGVLEFRSGYAGGGVGYLTQAAKVNSNMLIGYDPVLTDPPPRNAQLSVFTPYEDSTRAQLRLGTKRAPGSGIDYFYEIARNTSTGLLTFSGNETNGSGVPTNIGYRFANGNIVFVSTNNAVQPTIVIGTITATNLLANTTAANGTLYYCTNCTQAAACAAGGTGALAKRINSAWQCN